MPLTPQGRQGLVWPSLLGSEKFSVSQLRADLLRLDGGSILTDTSTGGNPSGYPALPGGYPEGMVWYDETASTLKVRRPSGWANVYTGTGDPTTDLSSHTGANPTNHANGSIVTAALANDAVTPAKIGPLPHARVRIALGTANINVPHLDEILIPFNEVLWATDITWTAGTRRLTVHTDGLYFIHGAVRFLADETVGVNVDRWLKVWRNGTLADFSDAFAIGVHNEKGYASDTGHFGHHLLEVSCTYRLVAGDWIRLVAQQTNALSVSTWLSPDMLGDAASADYTNFFEMAWLAP